MNRLAARREDAGVTVPPGLVVQVHESVPGCDWRVRDCTLAAECQP